MLIPVHFTIAGNFPFDNTSSGPNYTAGVAAGQPLTVYSNAQVYQGITYNKAYVKACSSLSNIVIGLAGDGFRTDVIAAAAGAAAGYAANIVISGNGDTTLSQNRISDLYKETLASGQMTVYSGSGTFRTDQYDGTQSYALGAPLYSNASGQITSFPNGTSLQVIGHCVGVPWAFPSGVPGVGGTWGTNWFDNSMALTGGNGSQLQSSQLLTFTLNV
jgi:hypothetical protein